MENNVEQMLKQATGGLPFLGSPDGFTAFGYVRTADGVQVYQEEELVVMTQLQMINNRAIDEGLKIEPTGMYFDIGSSGTTFEDREGLAALRNEIRKPDYQVCGGFLIMVDVSRLSRVPWQIGYLEDEFAKNNIRIVYVREGHVPPTLRSWAQKQIE